MVTPRIKSHNHLKIKKVLIANRAEIALRIQRACHQLGIKTVTALSEADKGSLAARKADQVAIIGPASAKESYLVIENIIKAAQQHGCDAVHPGYGFLSESADFADSVEAAGLVFIGPTGDSIRAMGNKTEARKRVSAVGVPVAPGTIGGLSDAELIKHSNEIGFPLMIKASAGGGGRGMRVVQSESELIEALPRARSEVLKNFGCDDIFLERYIERPRHVEVQIFGDSFSNVIHLGTRDCSTQRRNQKLIEEAPAPNLSTKLRAALHNAAVAAAQAVNYRGAGTCEFLVSGENFYFLEMNTRIQVEHPVTEEVTGLDLVQLQLKIAMGEKLPLSQKQVSFKGHAIEYRINAEDPYNNFAPARGRIEKLTLVRDRAARYEFGYETGDEIPLYYDGLIGKIVIKAPTRKQALKKSSMILSRCVILGVITCIDLDRWLIENGVLNKGAVDIGFIEREYRSGLLSHHFGANSHNMGKESKGFNEAKESGSTKDLASLERSSLKELSQEELKQIFRRELLTKEYRDPLHEDPLPVKGPLGEYKVEKKHFYGYESGKYKGSITIEVKHMSDGFFVATPIHNGRRGTSASRMCNGLRKALDSVITVLEKTPSEKISWN